MFCGKIFIKVVSAESLPDTVESKFTSNKDVPQLNPYVNIQIDEIDVAKVGIGTSAQKHTLNPTWNHVCDEIYVDFGEMISFTVYHNAVVKPDDFIANCNIPISSLLEAKEQKEAYKLKQSLDPSGLLKVEIRLEEEKQAFQRQEQVQKIYPIKGHKFRAKFFTQPVYCAHCDEFLWGVVGKQGLSCDNCSMTIHKRCYEDIMAECPGITKPELEEDPMERFALTNKHIFHKPVFFKPCFCKQCGEFILSGYECKVCKVSVHSKCRELTPTTCGVDVAQLSKMYKDAKNKQSKSQNEQKPAKAEPAQSAKPEPSQPAKPATPIENSQQETKIVGSRPNLDSFNLLKTLGKGAFGKVLLAQHKETNQVFAIKAVDKYVIIEGDDVEITLTERNVLTLGWHNRFLTKLHCSFQTSDRLFFVMEYLSGGDLMYHIVKLGKFPEDRARFYTAQITLALMFLHKKGIIYRDLKLDNVMLTNEGHIKLADFGMCKEGINEKLTHTFCGTPNYIAPEIVLGKKYGASVDWWALGVLTYEMIAGRSPFSSQDEEELFKKIRKDSVKFPKWLSLSAQNLIGQFLRKDPETRLGSLSNNNVQGHNFFESINWNNLKEGKVEPPFKPKLKGSLDTNNFDEDFTKELPYLEDVEMSKEMQDMCETAFQGFSFYNQN
eukprot:GFUD01022924.1.p1 GENE.GFUD01022924.1~~GFUD01022924.1.p1  ORF type:complete len:664 (+),score=141.22 GFUD01022924.1:113-2104(+)